MSKISLRIDPLFYVLAFAIGWLNSESLQNTFLWMVVIFISVLIHELGHALTALYFGQTSQITLMALGGLTSRNGEALSPFREFLIVFNGPLAGFCLYLACAYALGIMKGSLHPVAVYMLTIGAMANLFWTIVNLAPVLPLDGGRLLMIISKGIFGIRGVRVAYALSLIFSILLALGFFLINAFLAGSFFLLFAFESWRQFQEGRFLSAVDDKTELKEELKQATQFYSAGKDRIAKERFQSLREKTKSGWIYLQSTIYLALLEEKEGEMQKAYDLLIPEKEKLDLESLCLLQRLSYLTERYEECVKLGQEIFREQPYPDVAVLNAYCLAHMNQTIPAIGWLKTAMREGLEDPHQVVGDHALDPIRSTPEFRNFVNSISKH